VPGETGNEVIEIADSPEVRFLVRRGHVIDLVSDFKS